MSILDKMNFQSYFWMSQNLTIRSEEPFSSFLRHFSNLLLFSLIIHFVSLNSLSLIAIVALNRLLLVVILLPWSLYKSLLY